MEIRHSKNTLGIFLTKEECFVTHRTNSADVSFARFCIAPSLHNLVSPTYRHISAKIAIIGQNENICIGIFGRYVGANIYQYRQKYWLGEYIGIGWTHIGRTLQATLSHDFCLLRPFSIVPGPVVDSRYGTDEVR